MSIVSNQVSKGLLGLAEDVNPEDEKSYGDPNGEKETWEVNLTLTSEQAPPKTVDYADHWVEAVEEPPLLGNDRAGEAHRRNIESKLDDEWNDIAEVAILDVESRDPEAWAEGGEEGKENKSGEEKDIPVGDEPIPGHHANHDDEADEEIDEGDDHGGGGDDEAGKVDLADQVGVGDQAVGGFGKGGGEKGPGEHPGEDKEGIGGCTVGGQLGHFTEDDREDDHGEKGPNHCPGNADDGLLVANRNIPPGQDLEELPVTPEIAPVVFLGAARFDDGDLVHFF